MEEFMEYVVRKKPELFLKYQRASQDKRLEFVTVLHRLDINLGGINFLDIGPAYGDSLDVCHESGSHRIDFIERDPMFFTYNRLKGFTKGFRLNHMVAMTRLKPQKYDCVWAKGSVSADFFITSKLNSGNYWLSVWLDNLHSLVSSEAIIIICPYWANNHVSRKIEDVRNNSFTRTMLSRGYAVLPRIAFHNQEPAYPITFYKKFDSARL
jgi:hypothetical protein